MPGLIRSNTAGLLCSCIGHAVVVGGLVAATWSQPPRALAPTRAASPIMVTMVPLDGMQRPSQPEAESERSPLEPIAASDIPADDPLTVRPSLAVAAPSTVVSRGEAAGSHAPIVSSASSSAALSEYQRLLNALIARHCRYPAEAGRLNLDGVTSLAFTVDRSGRVLEAWIQDSSGSELIDNAALAALDQAQPLPPIPPNLPAQIDFVFRIDSVLVRRLHGSGG